MVRIFLNYNWGGTEVEHQFITCLCESVEVEALGATVVGRKPYEYLQQQTDIEYDPLYCVQNVHDEIVEKPYDSARINELEDRFGVPFLWPAIWADRKYIDYDSEKQKRLIHGWFEFYLDVFETFHPDLFLTPSVDSTYTWIPFRIVTEEYGMAVQKGHTRVRDKKSLQKTVYDNFEAVRDQYDSSSGTDLETQYPKSYRNATEFLEEFRSSGLSPGYTEDNSSSSTSSQSVIWETLNYWYQKNVGYYKDDFYHDSTRERIKTSIKRQLWRQRVDQLDIFQSPKQNENYVYFPLHLQPEASTMVKAPLYMHLPDVIRTISKSLPLNYNLYVKEHPSLYSYKVRPVDYYKEINDLPNTTLIHPSVDSHSLIKDAKAVTTVTGTAGLEGALYRKPVITFGNPNYDILSQVYTAGDPNQLAALISEAITTHTHTEDHERELLQYLTAIFEESYPSPHNKTGAELEDAIEKQCEVIKREIDASIPE